MPDLAPIQAMPFGRFTVQGFRIVSGKDAVGRETTAKTTPKHKGPLTQSRDPF
jgi:hypothetical protein